jgi:hypothetical protein
MRVLTAGLAALIAITANAQADTVAPRSHGVALVAIFMVEAVSARCDSAKTRSSFVKVEDRCFISAQPKEHRYARTVTVAVPTDVSGAAIADVRYATGGAFDTLPGCIALAAKFRNPAVFIAGLQSPDASDFAFCYGATVGGGPGRIHLDAADAKVASGNTTEDAR